MRVEGPPAGHGPSGARSRRAQRGSSLNRWRTPGPRRLPRGLPAGGARCARGACGRPPACPPVRTRPWRSPQPPRRSGRRRRPPGSPSPPTADGRPAASSAARAPATPAAARVLAETTARGTPRQHRSCPCRLPAECALRCAVRSPDPRCQWRGSLLARRRREPAPSPRRRTPGPPAGQSCSPRPESAPRPGSGCAPRCAHRGSRASARPAGPPPRRPRAAPQSASGCRAP
mmetsp:Transcript_30224/g.83393  ORF Transcript_30224/g.83393 Transcript_30224/m.83393 type:complete len:231 (+) Transcript_30224:42-734(+)